MDRIEKIKEELASCLKGGEAMEVLSRLVLVAAERFGVSLVGADKADSWLGHKGQHRRYLKEACHRLEVVTQDDEFGTGMKNLFYRLWCTLREFQGASFGGGRAEVRGLMSAINFLGEEVVELGVLLGVFPQLPPEPESSPAPRSRVKFRA